MNIENLQVPPRRLLGLTSAFIVFVVSLAGCISIFQGEIKDALKACRKVEKQKKAVVLPSKWSSIVQKLRPELQVIGIIYVNKDRSAR
ncbi:hypothetical protein [Pedobacter sp. L105]|uniref:hypothetical protein n=1 Tax=Pedobacter sp. L105 TaxID=1641871 RepID=UPI00131EA816|nr:hypothetical protein [Pedobacter sp. L105]